MWWSVVGGVRTNLTNGSGPPTREGGSLAYDAADGYVVLFGGIGFSSTTHKSSALNDLWKYSGGVWTDITPTSSPPIRGWASLTYDAKDGYVLLFGGFARGHGLGDTWKYLAGTWTQIPCLSTASSVDREHDLRQRKRVSDPVRGIRCGYRHPRDMVIFRWCVEPSQQQSCAVPAPARRFRVRPDAQLRGDVRRWREPQRHVVHREQLLASPPARPLSLRAPVRRQGVRPDGRLPRVVRGGDVHGLAQRHVGLRLTRPLGGSGLHRVTPRDAGDTMRGVGPSVLTLGVDRDTGEDVANGRIDLDPELEHLRPLGTARRAREWERGV